MYGMIELGKVCYFCITLLMKKILLPDGGEQFPC